MKPAVKLASVAVALALLLQGCAADLGFRVGSTGTSATQPSVGPGSSFSSGGMSARFSDGGAFATAIGAAILGALFGRDAREAGTRVPPALDPDRRVNEQDCTEPPRDTANLRCR